MALETRLTDEKKLTGDHIDMVSDALPELKKLEYFWFSHEEFPNTKKMEDILKDLGMKRLSINGANYTKYIKE